MPKNTTSNMMVEVSIDQLTFHVYIWHTPADPGRISGPPEKCYPGTDSECSITKVCYKDLDITDILAEFSDFTTTDGDNPLDFLAAEALVKADEHAANDYADEEDYPDED